MHMNHPDIIEVEIDDQAHTHSQCSTLSPIDIVHLQHLHPHVFLKMSIIQNPGRFQYSFLRWKRLLDDYSDRKLLLNDVFFKSKLSFQKLVRLDKKEKKDRKDYNIEWRCIMCVVVFLKVGGWCPGVIGKIATLMVE